MALLACACSCSPPINTNVPSSVATSREGLVEVAGSDGELCSQPEILFVPCRAGVANTAYRHVEGTIASLGGEK